jgi:pyruvate dehydrogenase E2 component (dihydrolipoamide acetyltransferase)
VFASPLARRLAAQAGLPLPGLAGSGPHGRIVKRDVQAALARATAARPSTAPVETAVVPEPAPLRVPGDVAVPHSAMRRTIARRLLESKTTIPHFYLRSECRMEALSALRRQINEAGRHVSINDIIVKAVAVALMDCPDMNVTWTDEALIRHAGADVSVAVSTPSGLITPVVRGVHDKSLSRVSAEIAALVARAREGRLSPQEYQGGSFTVSNLGMYGTTEFAAIINPPQAAILAVGAIERRVVAGPEGSVEVTPMMTVTLSVDHRAIDGAAAAKWLDAFRRVIENPLAALI